MGFNRMCDFAADLGFDVHGKIDLSDNTSGVYRYTKLQSYTVCFERHHF